MVCEWGGGGVRNGRKWRRTFAGGLGAFVLGDDGREDIERQGGEFVVCQRSSCDGSCGDWHRL